jgi:hypothetical protein
MTPWQTLTAAEFNPSTATNLPSIRCPTEQALTLPETEEAMVLEILMADALKLPLLIIAP